MKSAPLALLAAALLACPARGADPAPPAPRPLPAVVSIGGPTEVGAHKLVRLKAVGVAPDAAIEWEFADGVDVDPHDDGTDGTLDFAVRPGTYTVTLRATAIIGTKLVIRKAKHTFTVKGEAGPGPKPTPEPDPKPDPKPVPKAARARVIFLFDPADVTPAVAAVKNDTAFWQGLLDKGHTFRMYAATQAEAGPYKGDGPAPCVLVYDDAKPADPLKVVRLPAARDVIQKAISEVTQ